MSEQLVHHQHHTNTNIHKIILSDKEKTIMKKSKSVDNHITSQALKKIV